MNRFKTFHFTEVITSLTYVIGIILSLALFSLAQHWEEEHIEDEFNRVFAAKATALELEFALNLKLLANTVSFYNASNNVSRDEFAIFTTAILQQLPGVESISWAQKVTEENQASIIAQLEQSGHTLDISFASAFGHGDQANHAPIVFSEPIEKTQNKLGLDALADLALRDAAFKAQDLNSMTMANDFQKAPRVTTVFPVYKKAGSENATRRDTLFGFIIGEIKLDVLFEHAVQQLHTPGNKLNIKIIDANSNALIYERIDAPIYKTNLRQERQFQLGNHLWLLQATPTKSFIDARNTLQPPLILTASLLITLLLSNTFNSLSKKHQLVENIVAQRTLELEQSKKKLRTILDSTPNGIILVDEHNLITLINPAVENMLGYSSDKLLNHDIATLLPTELHTDQIARQGGLDTEAQHKDGHSIPINITVNELRYENQLFFVFVVTDITERAQNDKIKSEFISTVSHELRTPLTSINGALKLIAMQFPDRPKQMAELLTIAMDNTDRQLRLVNDLLDLQKVTAGKMTFLEEKLNLSELAQTAIDSFQGITQERKINIVLKTQGSERPVLADQHRLTQVIMNLLSNAIKFSPNGGNITINIQEHGISTRLSVTDEGPGIPDHFRKDIFNRFTQADSSDQRYTSGTGLGLAISKNFIEGMHGRIGYTSTLKQGSSFFIQIPNTKSDKA